MCSEGDLVESRHRGAVAIADARRAAWCSRLAMWTAPVYPRSAVKALQALPLVESGAADAFGLSDEELAVACASHSGDQVHLDAVGEPAGQGRSSPNAIWPAGRIGP